MNQARYCLRPEADRDLDEQAGYAHQTLTLLASQPNLGWHSRLKIRGLETLRVFRIRGFEKMLVLYLTQPDVACGLCCAAAD